MRLILNGGGSGEQLKECYDIFKKEIGGGKVLYIPLAWQNGSFEDCTRWFREQMRPLGITDIETITKPEQITEEKLKSVTGVFIGGGNAFKLLKMLKETDAFVNLQKFIANNGIVMGGSAGALIFGKSIDSCLKNDLEISYTDENLVALKDTEGFNIVKGFSLFVHYRKKADQLLQTQEHISRLIKDGHKIICLPEETSLWINGNNISIIGQKPAELFTSEFPKILNPNKNVIL